jgi:hypothetical protein
MILRLILTILAGFVAYIFVETFFVKSDQNQKAIQNLRYFCVGFGLVLALAWGLAP